MYVTLEAYTFSIEGLLLTGILYHSAQQHQHPDATTGPTREAMEIGLHPNDMNREGGFCVRRSWNSLHDEKKDSVREQYCYFLI
jgi:hypothetical protein